MHIDPERGTAVANAGVLWGEYDRESTGGVYLNFEPDARRRCEKPAPSLRQGQYRDVPRGGRAADTAEILTPDQRVRVFVSSTLNELAEERAAARRAIERLYLVPVMFELGARPHPPRSLYLAYLRQSHIFVGVYGEQYGWTAPDMEVSGLEDELRHATEKPMLIYVKTPAPGRDPRLVAMIDDVARTAGVSYKTFSTATELESLLATDLAVLLSERFATSGGAQLVTPQVPKPASEFVGRWAELDELVDLVTSDAVRLVTLTGPGGIGKTRLAIQVAHAVADRFPDGTVFVPLATHGPESFLEAVSAAVGLTDLGQEPLPQLLAEHLRDRRELLVLDNFEQLMPSAGDVLRLLERTQALTVLVTSRTALRLTGEEEFPVTPLDIPRVTRRVEDVLRAEAAQLFCRRVAAIRHGYRLTESDAETVARICRRLEGLPLALELVAARANVLSLDDLALRLDKVLDLSARSPDVPERQRTLRQTMDWSYEQLPPAARTVFAELGVFVGPFPLGAAEAVCGAEPHLDLLDELAVLVDHSLLKAQVGTDTARFSMLELISGYARSRLSTQALEQAAERHAEYYRSVAVDAYGGLRSIRQREMAERLDLDATNLGAALDWLLVRGRRIEAADICWSMFIYYWLRGALSEGRRWTQRALAAEGPITPLPNARLLAADAFFAFWQRDFDVAVSEGMEAVEIAQREADAELDMVVSLLLLIVLAGAGDEAGARSYAARGLRLARTHEDQWGVAMTLNALCWFDAALGQMEGKEAAFDEMFEAARELADPMVLAMAFANMAELRTWQGRCPEAAALLSEGIKMFAEMRLVSGGSSCLHGIAFLLAQLDDWAGAVQVQAATDAALQRIQATLWPPWLPRRERLLADAEQRLGPAAFEEALAVGREWTFEEVADQARAKLARVAETAPSAASAR